MKIGVDVDGTITADNICNSNIGFSLPWWLCYFLIPFLWSKPRKEVVEKMRLMKAQGHQFIIVTRWPDHFSPRVKKSLINRGVPFDGLFCVGFTKGADERKLKVIKDEKIDIFVDSNKCFAEFLKSNSVNAVTSLDCFK